MSERDSMGPLLLTGVFCGSLVAAQILATKIVKLMGLLAPAGFLPYAVTFLMTDIAGEVYGKHTANNMVVAGLIVNILLVVYELVAVKLPAPSFVSVQFLKIYNRIVLGSWYIVAGSLIAYCCSQTHDVWMFHKLRELTHGRYLWLRNNVSTVLSQLIDTTIFITCAFYLLPLLAQGTPAVPATQLPRLILGQWTLKVIVALCDTPFCYLGVRLARKLRKI